MNPTRILTVCMTAMLVAGSAALAAEPAADPRTTVLPIYTLPQGAAADGKLAEWGGIPPVPAERFNIGPFNSNPDPAKRPVPDNFAPALRCGMKPGSPDLYFLIVVRDSQRYTEPKAAWIEGDRVELFLDFGRQARDEQQPDWWKDKDRNRFANPPGMGQFGLGPQTLAFAAEARVASDAGKWKYDYACVPVEGGVAYELRVDGQSVLVGTALERQRIVDVHHQLGFDLGDRWRAVRAVGENQCPDLLDLMARYHAGRHAAVGAQRAFAANNGIADLRQRECDQAFGHPARLVDDVEQQIVLGLGAHTPGRRHARHQPAGMRRGDIAGGLQLAHHIVGHGLDEKAAEGGMLHAGQRMHPEQRIDIAGRQVRLAREGLPQHVHIRLTNASALADLVDCHDPLRCHAIIPREFVTSR